MTQVIEKVLAPNDVGETGGNQAGPYVGAPATIPDFFPDLDENDENPHAPMSFVDGGGREYQFELHYYNAKHEYHLTHMTAFFRDHDVRAGDRLVLSREDGGTLRVEIRKPGEPAEGAVVGRSGPWTILSVPSVDPEEQYVRGLPEGAKTRVQTNRYERSPENRRRCLEAQGVRCLVCGFDFGDEFGEVGMGFIHVHHLTPVAQLGEDYVIDPVRDLIPVCPNCHAMLHKRQPPYTVKELQAIRYGAE